MTTVKLDDKSAAQFAQVTDLVAVTDAAGRTVGYFAPVATREELMRRHLFATVNPEQLRRQKATPEKTYTTEEVKAYLRSLGK
ncbi:MAG TPA: hypothetical protein VFG68_06175 [Fimbriiglobus sp.]|nr:hypothetical protein [Fimbriiglobus sp.]